MSKLKLAAETAPGIEAAAAATVSGKEEPAPELTIVMPCLNEAAPGYLLSLI